MQEISHILQSNKALLGSTQKTTRKLAHFWEFQLGKKSWLYGLCRTTLKVNYLGGSFSAFLGIILCTCHINRVIETKLVKFEANLTSLSSSCSFLICSWRTCSASSRSCASLCKNGNIEKKKKEKFTSNILY